MKTIRILLFCVAIFITNLVVAQSKTMPDPRLLEIYSAENLTQMNAATIDYLNFYLENGWFIADESVMKKVFNSPFLYYADTETGMKSKNMVTTIDLQDINILKFYVETDFNNKVFYRVGDTGIIIGFHSTQDLANMYNNSKK